MKSVTAAKEGRQQNQQILYEIILHASYSSLYLTITYQVNWLLMCVKNHTWISNIRVWWVHTAILTPAIPTQASPNHNCLNPNVTGGRSVGIAVVRIAGWSPLFSSQGSPLRPHLKSNCYIELKLFNVKTSASNSGDICIPISQRIDPNNI